MSSPRTPHPWLVLALAVTMQAVTIGIGSYAFAFFVVPWMEEFGTLRGTLMIAATGSTIGTAILSPFCGYLLDRFSSRALVLTGASAFAFGMAAIALAPSSFVVILIYILALPFGMVLAGTLMASSLVARSFHRGRGMALGISALGTSLGGLVMPVLITQVLALYDWRTLFFILAALVVITVFVPAALILRDDGDTGAATRTHARASTASASLMRSPAVIKLGIAFLVPGLVFIAVLPNLGSLATDLAISQQRAAGIVSVASVAMVLIKLVSGALCDRVDQRLLYLGVVVIQAAGLITLAVASSFTLLFAGVTLVCIGSGGNLPIITSFAARFWGPERFGRMMGVVFAMAGISGTGALLAGIIRDASGSYTPAFLSLLVVLVPAAWCFLTLGRHSPEVATE